MELSLQTKIINTHTPINTHSNTVFSDNPSMSWNISRPQLNLIPSDDTRPYTFHSRDDIVLLWMLSVWSLSYLYAFSFFELLHSKPGEMLNFLKDLFVVYVLSIFQLGDQSSYQCLCSFSTTWGVCTMKKMVEHVKFSSINLDES